MFKLHRLWLVDAVTSSMSKATKRKLATIFKFLVQFSNNTKPLLKFQAKPQKLSMVNMHQFSNKTMKVG